MKELEVFRYDMGGSNSAIAFQRTICLILTAIIMIQLFSQLSHAEVKNYAEDWDEDITITGGRTILVEELSATWCTSCADIDPFLQQVADAHGSRISIVTYHPTDGEDAFQPEAAKYRIERMKSINSDVGSTPTFVVESGELRVGPDSWPDVQKDILKEETSRQEFSKLS
ncbi:MAG: thioredoxin family protein, partial [Candidatus Thermoplasmatota archaeon]|nr:thioredoxin family protein [Candidatus Thermoplasmatota archaeon]